MHRKKTSQSGAEKIANGKPDMRKVSEEARVFVCAFVSLVKIKIALFHHHLFINRLTFGSHKLMWTHCTNINRIQQMN